MNLWLTLHEPVSQSEPYSDSTHSASFLCLLPGILHTTPFCLIITHFWLVSLQCSPPLACVRRNVVFR